MSDLRLATALHGVTYMIKIQNHLEVYVDSDGKVCLAQPSMDEACEIVLEPYEVQTLITWLKDALSEAVGIGDRKGVTVVLT